MDFKYVLLFIISDFLRTWGATYASATTQQPPYFIQQPPVGELFFNVVSDRFGGNVPIAIECEAYGKPAPRYRWVKNGKDFMWQEHSDRMSVAVGMGTLVITSAKDEDAGQYQCFAENDWGTSTSNSVFLRKVELSSFKEASPQMMVVKEGEPFNLTCEQPRGVPNPNIYWLIQNHEGGIKTISSSRITLDPEARLWFSYATKEDKSDDSVYACAATSYYKNEVKLGNRIALQVTTSPSKEKNTTEPFPQYLSNPQEVAVRGKKKRLYCIFGGTPVPDIFWYKNGEPIDFETGDRFSTKNFGKSLSIQSVTEVEEGNYTCEAKNGIGSSRSHTMILTMLAEPYFLEEPESVTTTEDETVQIHCNVAGNPMPDVHWIYNGRPLSESPPNSRRKVVNNSIIIENLIRNDTANYGCNATNSLGYVFKDVYVNVLVMEPEILKPPKDLEIIAGSSAVMTCRFVGLPKPQIKWLKNGVELADERFTVEQNGDLFIESTKFTDTGVYTCLLWNKLSSTNATGMLIVRNGTHIDPNFVHTYNVIAGQNVSFNCFAETDNSLDLKMNWQKDGHFLADETSPGNNSSLTFFKISLRDAGTYTCVASTRLDNATAIATVHVQDVPSTPKLLSLTCHGRTAVLRWQPSSSNGASILNYIVQYSTSNDPRTWDKALNVAPVTEERYTKIIGQLTNVTVNVALVQKQIALFPGKTYSFRVVAKNIIGVSDSSNEILVCQTEADVPLKNPENVSARLEGLNSLVISWTVLPESEHNGPEFYYKVMWKQNKTGEKWNIEKITKWEINEFIIDLPDALLFCKFSFKVISGNKLGDAKVPAKEVTIYTQENVPLEGPSDLKFHQLYKTSASLSWNGVPEESMRGHFKGYRILIWPPDDSLDPNRLKEIVIYDNVTDTVIEGLRPKFRNMVYIVAFNAKYDSPPSNTISIDVE